jgi:hypothetical protein
LNFDFIVSKTPQRANKKPYRHGTGAPRHYPHTLIVAWCVYTLAGRALFWHEVGVGCADS